MENSVIDTIYIHAVNLVLAIATIVILLDIYFKRRKLFPSDFVLYMILLPLVAAIHFAIYSAVLVIDHLDGVISYPLLYNVWGLFLFTQILLTKLWLAVIAWRKYNKGNKK